MNQLYQIICAYPIQSAQWVRSIHIDYLQFMLLAFFFSSVCMAHYSFKVEALKQFSVLWYHSLQLLCFDGRKILMPWMQRGKSLWIECIPILLVWITIFPWFFKINTIQCGLLLMDRAEWNSWFSGNKDRFRNQTQGMEHKNCSHLVSIEVSGLNDLQSGRQSTKAKGQP